MQHQSLPELIALAQQLHSQIRQHPQYQRLQIDCDLTFGDVSQFFNSLQWSASSCSVDVSKEGFSQ